MAEIEKENISTEIAVRRTLIEKVICVKGSVGNGTKENPVKSCSLYYTTNGVFIGKITS